MQNRREHANFKETTENQYNIRKNIWGRQRSYKGVFEKIPLWLLLVLLLFVVGYWKSLREDTIAVIFFAVVKGLGVTFFVSFVGFTSAVILGFVVGLLRCSKIYVVSQFAAFYIEVLRGLPILVVLYYIAFVMAPFLVQVFNVILTPLISLQWIDSISIRDFSFLWRGIIALIFAYSAFIAEIFRAGIEAIDHGQIEAAKSLGFTKIKMFFPIILPQAVRNVLPALANELVAMVKDSALVSILGVADITQIGRVYAASTFRFFETYNIVALLYLSLTITLSLGVKIVEKKFSSRKRSYKDMH